MKMTINSTSYVIKSGNKIFINGDEIERPKDMKMNSITQIGNNIFIGGYQFNHTTKTFKRTLRALWHLYF